MMSLSPSAAKYVDATAATLAKDENSHCFNDYDKAKAYAVKLYIAAYLLDGKSIDPDGALHVPGAYHDGDRFIMNRPINAWFLMDLVHPNMLS